MEVWFRWFSFSIGQCLGAKAVNFQRGLHNQPGGLHNQPEESPEGTTELFLFRASVRCDLQKTSQEVAWKNPTRDVYSGFYGAKFDKANQIGLPQLQKNGKIIVPLFKVLGV